MEREADDGSSQKGTGGEKHKAFVIIASLTEQQRSDEEAYKWKKFAKKQEREETERIV